MAVEVSNILLLLVVEEEVVDSTKMLVVVEVVLEDLEPDHLRYLLDLIVLLLVLEVLAERDRSL